MASTIDQIIQRLENKEEFGGVIHQGDEEFGVVLWNDAFKSANYSLLIDGVYSNSSYSHRSMLKLLKEWRDGKLEIRNKQLVKI